MLCKQLACAAVMAMMLAACGGGGGGGGATPVQPPLASTYTLGGAVTGLRAGDAVVLKNGSDSVTVSANANYSFPAKLQNGAAYAVTAQAPAGYSCKVTNGAGSIASADVTKVAVDCAPMLLTGKIAPIQQPNGIALDASGNAWVLDIENHVVMKVDPSGNATIVAGTPNVPGYLDGQGGAVRFHFDYRSSIAIDSSGNFGIADSCNAVIRKMTPDGVVTTMSGVQNNLCMMQPAPGSYPQPADGSAATARFGHVTSIASDRAGGFYVADFDMSQSLRHILPTGTVVSTRWPLAAFNWFNALAVDSKGVVWMGDEQSRIWSYNGSGTPVYVAGKPYVQTGIDPADGPAASAEFVTVGALAIDASDNLYIGDVGSIRKLTPAGVVSTVAGSFQQRGLVDGIGKSAQVGSVTAIASDAAGKLVFAESGRTSLRRVSTAGAVTTIDASAAVGYVDGPAAQARLESVRQPAVDSAGNVYVTDPLQHVVRKIAPDGTVSLFAGIPGTAGTQDGALASATFKSPAAIAVGPGDALYLVDGASVRKIANGTVSTVVARVANVTLFAIAVDSAGNIATTAFEKVYGISPSGQVTTLMDSTILSKTSLVQGLETSFLPQGIAFDASGNLFISDTGLVTIWKLTNAGAISVFAGTPMVEGDADGPVGMATFGYYGVDEMTIDDSGNLYLSGQGRLRKISPAGVTSTPNLDWVNPNLHGLAWRNGKLYGLTRYALLQIYTP